MTTPLGAPAGRINVVSRVTATDLISLRGKDRMGRIASGFFSETGGMGNAGSVTVAAPYVLLQEGATIAASTGGDGSGGNISIQTGRLSVDSGAQIQSSSGIDVDGRLFVGTGQGGRVNIMATYSVDINGLESGGFTRTQGAGQGGNVSVQAPQLSMANEAAVSAASFNAGNAGEIQLQYPARRWLHVRRACHPLPCLLTVAEGRGTSKKKCVKARPADKTPPGRWAVSQDSAILFDGQGLVVAMHLQCVTDLGITKRFLCQRVG
jgi:hypothetical protein